MRSILPALPALLVLAACDGGTQAAGYTDEDTAPNERAVDAGEAAPEETASSTPDPESAE